MLAIALFAGAAAFTLGAVRSVMHTLERSAKRQQAVDLARTRLAELEAGLITLRDLQGESGGASDSPARASRDAAAFDERAAAERPRWRMEVRTTRSEFTALTLVELTVFENLSPEQEAAGASAMQYTLRQLVAVREDAAEPWEQDELMQGLPKNVDAESGGGQ